MTQLTILIIGGYGVFGGRIVTLLESDPRLTLIVAGRNVEKARAFVQSRGQAHAALKSARFDRDGDMGARLAMLRPDIVVDASGPFQAYGAARYRVIEACIDKGVHYLDLADGSAFVAGVAVFDAPARAKNLFILSGVSSFPVLTAAVVRQLAKDMARVDSIRGGIAPSPFAGVGENVIRAIASYAGQPIRLRRGGASATGHPLTEHVRFTISPPGRAPLRNTWFSLVDVPDLEALTAVRPDAKDIWMGAGPVPELLHRALAACAQLVRLKLVPTLSPMAPLMHFAMNHLRWGEHRGGMFVVVDGVDEAGKPASRSWHLLAEGDDGPLIPSMAVEAIVRKMLDGAPPRSGGRAAINDLELDDYEKLFAGRTIYTGFRDGAAKATLYEGILGDAFAALPEPIRAMHEVSGKTTASGIAKVTRGNGLLARLAAALIGFPKAGENVPMRVDFTAGKGVETWTRTFAGQSFSSRQFAGRGRSEHLLCETFGPLTFTMALVVEEQKLKLVLRRWSFLGLPLPLWLCPRSNAHETAEQGRFHFHVEISHPLTGLIVRYEGALARPVPVAISTPTPTASGASALEASG
jgi:hypothetical protein